LDFNSASPLKQQSVGRPVTILGHNYEPTSLMMCT
jgi:hypothetical protein